MSKAAKDGKDKGKKKDKNGKGAGSEDAISIAGHPRAGAYVRRAKGWGGLAGFGLAGYLSLKAGVPVDQAGERAIAGGAGGYVLAWGCSVTIWRQLVIAELRALAAHHHGEDAPGGAPEVGA
jgi:hypothetical protein